MFNALFTMPHGHCYLWRPDVLWLHVISDAIIGAAYFSIPLALIFYKLKSKYAGKLITKVLWLFITFILCCGLTHFVAIWTVWHPDYYFQGFIKALTAVVSIFTAVVLWPLMPKALKIPSPEALYESEKKLKDVNKNLKKSISRAVAASEARSQELEEKNEKLQRFNKVTVGREERMVMLKKEINELCLKYGEQPRYKIVERNS